ncbi:alpha-tubulin N-acetyltransferase 1 isoform X2 [Syngnathus scovelli]|uniref:alpha-tubulin N-acetyltransferase 1 isoform X2 n=1 Tax=Syngnathus scovelli TaxID=161590 RepID=UPI0035CB7310
MEFPFNVNQLFPERFSILDKSLVVEHASPKRADLQSHIATVIDELGRASAKAQKLTTPVTSATKLQSQHHEVYLMKDGESNGECGVIVGFLKVGYKKLILLDRRGEHTEAEPLCVLDFFVAENLQRHGYGLELFHFMVQVNNFVVFDGFFNNKSVAKLRTIPLKKPDSEIKPYSIVEREAVRREERSLPWPLASSQCSLSVGSSPTRAALGVRRDQRPNFPRNEPSRERRASQQGQVAREGLYSRHMDSRSLGRPLAGLRSAKEQAHLSQRLPKLQSRLHTPPTLSATEDNALCWPTSPGRRKLRLGTDAEVADGEKELPAPNDEAALVVEQGHVSVVSRGPLSEDGLSKMEERCELQGTGALIMLLPALSFSEDDRNEQDVALLSALLQLKQLQRASTWHCPLPLVILVPGPDGITCNTGKLEEELMLPMLVKDGLISEYMLLFIPESTNDMQGSKSLAALCVGLCPAHLHLSHFAAAPWRNSWRPT